MIGEPKVSVQVLAAEVFQAEPPTPVQLRREVTLEPVAAVVQRDGGIAD